MKCNKGVVIAAWATIGCGNGGTAASPPGAGSSSLIDGASMLPGQVGSGASSSSAGAGAEAGAGDANVADATTADGGNDATLPIDGGSLPPALTWTLEYGEPIQSVWGSGPNDVYAVGNNGIIVHSVGDGTWTFQTAMPNATYYGVWGSGPNDVYIAPFINVLLHSTGDGGWRAIPFTSGATFNGIWGSGPNDIYTWQLTEHYTADAGWAPIVPGQNGEVTLAIWGSGPNDVYFAGSMGNIYHLGGGPEAQPVSTQALSSVGGSGPADVYTSDAAYIYHSTGNGTWTPQALARPSNEGIRAIFALSTSAAFAVTDTYVFRSNGAGTWVGQQIDPTISCFALWGTSPTNLYVGTDHGVYHGVQ